MDLTSEGRAPVVIGVTGHRLLTELDRLRAGVETALDRIEHAYPGRPFLVLSSLAEGADRLVADVALRRPKARLVVPLPQPVDDYIKDFAAAESKSEFERLLAQASEVITLPPALSRRAAFEAAGHYVVDRCDVLLAVWDGQLAQSQGGTGTVVAEARQQGKPLVWVHAGNRKLGTQEPTSLGAEQGMVTEEGL